MEDWRFLFERICNNWKSQYWLFSFGFSLDCWFFRFVALLFLLCFFKFHMVFFFFFFFLFLCLFVQNSNYHYLYFVFQHNKIDGKLTITVTPGTRPPVEIIISKCYSDAAGESFSFFGMICLLYFTWSKEMMDFFFCHFDDFCRVFHFDSN